MEILKVKTVPPRKLHRWNPGERSNFAMLFTLKTTRKAGGLQIPRCQGFAVNNYRFTLDALTLKPSGFCNVGVH